ncbi:MAG: alpha/beta hydrolase [Hyphomonadaceae bacterium]
MVLIDGPRLPPAKGAKAQALIVLLHGYGSNGDDLISLAPYWSRALPYAQFIAPNAPESVPGAPMGYQWFPIARIDPHAMTRGAESAAATIESFLERECARYRVDARDVALVGFSQGAMMALHVGLRSTRTPACVLAYSGMLTGAASLKSEAKSKPPILLVHGERDDRIPLSSMFDAADALCDAGLSAQWHISYGLGHSIGQDGLELGEAFLKMTLPAALRPAAG